LVFVAMTFDPALSTAWTDGLQPGIAAAGYRPERVDTGHHNGKIDDRIMAMIREARFVVVDVTTQNRGAYFEAGFALGLDRPVLWSVRADEIDSVHFDTRQFNHIVWSDPADLRDKIRDRILGVFGRGPTR
jgi:nucleoside 2-deoxyribosyltransferase